MKMKSKSKTGIKKLGLRVMRTMLFNRGKRVLRDLDRKANNMEKRISNKRQKLVRLKKAFRELQARNRKLQTRLRKMRPNADVDNTPPPNTENYPNGNSMALNNPDGIAPIKKKYPNFPKDQIQRIEVERTIARHLMANNSGCFYVSQILKMLEELYSVKPNDRIMLLTEIKSWIERDPLCRIVKTLDKVHHYTFI